MDKNLSQEIVNNDKKSQVTLDLRQTYLELKIIYDNIKKLETKMKQNISEDDKQKIINGIESIIVFIEETNKKNIQPNKKSSISNNFDVNNYEVKYNTNEQIHKKIKLNKPNIIDIKYNRNLQEEIENFIKNIKKQLNIVLNPVKIPNFTGVIKTEHPKLVIKPKNIILQNDDIYSKLDKLDKIDEYLKKYIDSNINDVDNTEENNELQKKINRINKLLELITIPLNED